MYEVRVVGGEEFCSFKGAWLVQVWGGRANEGS